MKIDKETAESIVYQDQKDWKKIEETIEDQGRWSTQFLGIFKHLPTNKFYKVYYAKGSTECQDEELFYDNEVDFVEVELKEVLVEQWVRVE